MIHILTSNQFRRAVEREVARSAANPGYQLKLYSRNSRLLRLAAAAYSNVPVDTINRRPAASIAALIRPFERVLDAVGEELAQIKEEEVYYGRKAEEAANAAAEGASHVADAEVRQLPRPGDEAAPATGAPG